MIARVVTKRDDSRLASAATLAAPLGLLGVLLHDRLTAQPFYAPPAGLYAAVALLIMVAGVGPWLAWTRRGRAMRVTCEPGAVHAGDLAILATEVTGLQIAKGAWGWSVAVTRGRKVAFFEVERADDARRIAEALEIPALPFGELGVRPASRSWAAAQVLLTMLSLLLGPLYFVSAAVHPLSVLEEVSGKTVFGVGGFVVACAALVVLVARRLAPDQALALGRGTWDAHVALHGREVAEVANEQAHAEPIRVANLGRGDEPVGAWLARLDAIPRESHAYRGDAMKKDVLWETLGDAGAPVDARMAAARVLRRRYGEEERAIVRVVDDRDVRVRVEAALEEHDVAEEHIERLGPLFRAR